MFVSLPDPFNYPFGPVFFVFPPPRPEPHEVAEPLFIFRGIAWVRQNAHRVEYSRRISISLMFVFGKDFACTPLPTSASGNSCAVISGVPSFPLFPGSRWTYPAVQDTVSRSHICMVAFPDIASSNCLLRNIPRPESIPFLWVADKFGISLKRRCINPQNRRYFVI